MHVKLRLQPILTFHMSRSQINVILQNGSFQTETRPYVHRALSTFDQRSLTFNFGKLRDQRNNILKRKQWILFSENERHANMFPNSDNYFACSWLFAFSRKMTKGTPLWCEGCRFVCFERGSSCWPWMTRIVLKIPQLFILSISNCEWHCPVKSAPESENMCDLDGRTYVDQVSPPTW